MAKQKKIKTQVSASKINDRIAKGRKLIQDIDKMISENLSDYSPEDLVRRRAQELKKLRSIIITYFLK